MKTLMTLIVGFSFATLSVAAPHPGWTDRRDVAKWSDEIAQAATQFAQSCQNADSSYAFRQFLQKVSSLKSRVDYLKRYLYRGHGSCITYFKRVRDEYVALNQTFETNFASHRNFRVRLGWFQLKYRYMELDWAFTQGVPIR